MILTRQERDENIRRERRRECICVSLALGIPAVYFIMYLPIWGEYATRPLVSPTSICMVICLLTAGWGVVRLLHHKPLRAVHFLMLGISLVVLIVSVTCFVSDILHIHLF
jgi:hypothetical protein